MYRLAIPILLQHKDTRPLRVVWIVLNDQAPTNTAESIFDQDIIGREFIVAML